MTSDVVRGKSPSDPPGSCHAGRMAATRDRRVRRTLLWSGLWCLATAFLLVTALAERAWGRAALAAVALAIATWSVRSDRADDARAVRSKQAALAWPPARVAALLEREGVPVTDTVKAAQVLRAADPALRLTETVQLVGTVQPVRDRGE